MNLSIKPFGPWGKVRELYGNLGKNIQEIATASQRSIVEKYIRKIKAHLVNQDISGWTPLSPKYADFKMGKYGHEDILIASHDFYDNIKVWREGGLYHGGVPKGISYPGGPEIAAVAYIHEVWSTMPGKPHRPLWGYTLNRDMGGIRGMKKLVNDVFAKKLKDKGYRPRKFF